ncbi:hypothetical protein KY345_03400 [Candidatus Woesearchaeota archaeon]|nr:hypothetical protein [Candidatus Woesearchaeota archaeon]
MKTLVEKPKYEAIEDILKDKSGKQINVYQNPNRQNQYLLAITDQRGEGYFIKIEDGRVIDKYIISGRKQQMEDIQKLFKEYNLDRYFGFKNAA